MTDPIHPSKETRDAERAEAGAAHQADRAPTGGAAAAAEALELSPEVAEHEREMAERGAHQKGEGRIALTDGTIDSAVG